MWTPTTHAQHRRDHLRYARDLADAERAVLEPLFPAARATGRPPTPLRRVLEAVFCVLRGGIAVAHAARGVPALPDRVRPVRGVAR